MKLPVGAFTGRLPGSIKDGYQAIATAYSQHPRGLHEFYKGQLYLLVQNSMLSDEDSRRYVDTLTAYFETFQRYGYFPWVLDIGPLLRRLAQGYVGCLHLVLYQLTKLAKLSLSGSDTMDAEVECAEILFLLRSAHGVSSVFRPYCGQYWRYRAMRCLPTPKREVDLDDPSWTYIPVHSRAPQHTPAVDQVGHVFDDPREPPVKPKRTKTELERAEKQARKEANERRQALAKKKREERQRKKTESEDFLSEAFAALNVRKPKKTSAAVAAERAAEEKAQRLSKLKQEKKKRKERLKNRIPEDQVGIPITINAGKDTRDWITGMLTGVQAAVSASVSHLTSFKDSWVFKFTKKALLVCLVYMGLKVFKGAITQAVRTIIKLFIDDEGICNELFDPRPVDQGVIDIDVEKISKLMVLVFGGISWKFALGKLKDGNVSEFIYHVTRNVWGFARKTADLESFIQVILDVINGVLGFFCDLLKRERVMFGQSSLAYLRELIAEANLIHQLNTQGKFDCKNQKMVSRLFSCHTKVCESIKNYVHTPAALASLTAARIQLDRVIQVNRVYLNSSDTRALPVCMLLYGEPGIGKSTVQPQLGMDIMSAIGIEEPTRFVRTPEKFMSGYAENTHIIVLDDFLAAVQTEDETSDASFLMKAVGTEPYILPMADVADKGRVRCNPRLIIGSTNCKKMSDVSKVLNHTEALRRRLHIVVEMTPNPEYIPEFFIPNPKYDGTGAKFHLDPVKIRDYVDTHRVFPWWAWQGQEVRYTDTEAKRVGSKRPFSDFIVEARNMLIRNNAIHMKALDTKAVPTDWGAYKNGPAATEDARPQDQVGPLMLGAAIFACKKLADFTRARNNLLVTCSDYSSTRPENYTEDQYNEWKSEFWERLNYYTDAISAITDFVAVLAVAVIVKKIWEGVRSLFPKGIKHESSNAVNGLMTKMTDEDRLKVVNYARSLLKPEQTTKRQSRLLARLQARVRVKSKVDDQSNLEMFSHPEVHISNVQRCVQGNIVVVQLVNDNGCQLAGRGLALGGFLYLINKHVLDTLSRAEVGSVRVTYYNKTTRTVTIPIDAWKKLSRVDDETRDLSIVSIPSMVSAARDLTKFFMLESDRTTAISRSVRVEVATVGSTTLDYLVQHCTIPEYIRKQDVKSKVRSEIVDVLCYPNIKTYSGDCGSIVYLDPPIASRVICGIHTAGHSTDTATGYASVVTQEIISGLISRLEKKDKDVVFAKDDVVFQGFSEDALPYTGAKTFVPVRIVPKELMKSRNPFSQLKHTSVTAVLRRNQWPIANKKPAHLSPFLKDGVLIDPMVKAVSVYDGQHEHFDGARVRQAAWVALKPMRERIRFELRSVSFEEAVKGIFETPTARGLPRKTSCGYPLCLRFDNGKKQFFGFGDEYEFDTPACIELRAQVEDILIKARQGVRTEHIFVDFLKDELRSEAKVVNGETRLISSAPLAYVIAFRMLFLDLTSQIQRHHIFNGLGVGMNVFSEWGPMLDHLTKHTTYGFDGDFKNFDAHHQPQILLAVGRALAEMYSDDDYRARMILWQDVYNSRHIGGPNPMSCIYDWTMSLPSGHPATSIINSYANLVLFILCYEDLTGRPMEEFWKDVSICVYGDDNIVFPNPSIVDVFNQNTMPAPMARYGQIYTSALKDGTVLPDVRHYCELSFLKRKTNIGETGYRDCPIELPSIFTMVLFVKDRNFELQIQRDNMEMCLKELALHGKAVFETYSSILMKSFHTHYGITPARPPDFDVYLEAARAWVQIW